MRGFLVMRRSLLSCIQNLGVDDLSYSGCFHTWTNNQSGSDFVSKKLDRVLSNCEWLNQFGNTSVEFLTIPRL
jgi:predicted PolB exonuclease-like 3'-5' exonuclease